MPGPKGVTIKLTSKQQAQLRNLTGEDHKEVRFERASLETKATGRKPAPPIATGRKAAPPIATGRKAAPPIATGRSLN